MSRSLTNGVHSTRQELLAVCAANCVTHAATIQRCHAKMLHLEIRRVDAAGVVVLTFLNNTIYDQLFARFLANFFQVGNSRVGKSCGFLDM